MPTVDKTKIDWVPICAEELKIIYDDMLTESGAKVIFHSFVCDAESENGEIKSITVANKAGLTLVAVCGEEKVVFNLDDYTADENGIITIVYDGILANELDTVVTFTMMDGEEAVGKVLTVNANSYLYRVSVGTDAKLASLAKALYAYGVSAKNYAN